MTFEMVTITRKRQKLPGYVQVGCFGIAKPGEPEKDKYFDLMCAQQDLADRYTCGDSSVVRVFYGPNLTGKFIVGYVERLAWRRHKRRIAKDLRSQE